MGIETIIFDLRYSGAIEKAIQRNYGTVCLAHRSSLRQRQQWLSSGNIVRGKIQVRKHSLPKLLDGAPLLITDVLEVIEPFAKGEVFEILDSNRNSMAVARSAMSSKSIETTSVKDRVLARSGEILLL